MKSEWGKSKSSTTERSECCASALAGEGCKAKQSRLSTSECRAPILPGGTARPKVVHRDSRAKGEASTALCRASFLAGETAKGQISAEFIITLILLFSMFSFIVLISSGQKENIDLGKEKIQAKTLLEKTSRTVNGIYLAGNGSTTKITKNFDLNFGIEENSLRVEFGKGQFVSTSLLTKRVVFIRKDNAKEIEVRNENGVIEIEEL